MPGSGVLFTKLKAVPPEYATLTGLPRSNTVNMYDRVPGVWPGVSQMVTVVPPSVICIPSVATMSRFGHGLVTVRIPATVSQSAAPIRPAPRSGLRHLGASDMVAVGVEDENVLNVLGVEPDFAHTADQHFLGVGEGRSCRLG